MRLSDSKRERAAWALAQGDPQAEVAREISVNRATITKWLRDPAFCARIDELKLTRDQVAVAGTDLEQYDEDAELAERVAVAWKVVDAAMLGTPGPNGSVPTTAQHSNALKTLELAHKLKPKSTERSDAPPLADLIAQADASRER